MPDQVSSEIPSLEEMVAAARSDLRGFSAKPGESLVISQGAGDPLVVLLGTGNFVEAGDPAWLESLRLAGAEFSRQVLKRDVHRAGSGGACIVIDRATADAGALQVLAEGILLGSYRFDLYKRAEVVSDGSYPVVLVVADEGEEGALAWDTTQDAVRSAVPRARRGAGQGAGQKVVPRVGEDAVKGTARDVDKGIIFAKYTAFARDLANTPARDMTPEIFCERVGEAAAQVGTDESAGIDIEIWDKSRIVEERLGGLIGVSSGSAHPPRLLRMTYDPYSRSSAGSQGAPLHQSVPPHQGNPPHIVLVGKGVTFDSGGLSLKQADSMTTMKTDMSGAAIVCASLLACAEYGVSSRITAIAPLTENMPGEDAVAPGDVLTMRNGSTVEVLNTDAEGRLILADALSLATELSPDAIIDVATLTGACVIALGKRVAGAFTNRDHLFQELDSAALTAGEPIWRLPLVDEYRDHIDSEIADMKNIGKSGQAGAISAALMLERFVEGMSWMHLDIAGPARSDEDSGYVQKGATAFGVRLLGEYICNEG